MHRTYRSVALFTLLSLLIAGASFASVRAAKPVGGPDPAVATVAFDAEVREIRADGTLVLAPEKAAELIEIRIPEGVQIRAQKKKDFDGRRKLEFADLHVGQRLRLTVLPAEQRLVGVTVLKTKAT